MATTKKITDLPSIVTASSADVVPVQQGGVTKQMPLSAQPVSNAAAGALAATGGSSFDPTLLPFGGHSPWRLGIAEDAKFAPDNDARNVTLNNVNASGGAGVNYYQYSHPVAVATASDPLASVTDSFHPAGGIPAGGTWLERIPATAKVAAGTDKHMHVITPDKKQVLEHFGMARTDSTHYTTTRRHRVSLFGSGIGPQNGTRAFGGSAIAGLIRNWEMDPTHPKYTGVIAHPIAIACRSAQMLYTGKIGGDGYGDAYDSSGYGLKRGYVWPATEQDYNSDTAYTGSIPMGSYFAIPPTVDVSALGLDTVAGRMVAQAMQDYGAYITDTSGTTTIYLEDADTAAEGDFASQLMGGSSYTLHDIKILFASLRVVTSNGPSTPNGGPLSAARRGVLPTSLAGAAGTDGAPYLAAATVSTAATGTLALNTVHPIDATAANATRSLPTPTKVGQVIRVEKTDATANTVAITGTIRGANGTVSLVWQYESIDFFAESLTSWRPGPGHRTKSSLDGAYAQLLEPVTATNSGTAITLNGIGVQDVTLTGNATITFPSLPASGLAKTFVVVFRQDGTGARTVTWPATMKWPGGVAPVLSTAAAKVDVFTFTSIDGVSWFGFTSALDLR